MLRYGLGLGYDLFQSHGGRCCSHHCCHHRCCGCNTSRLTSVVEFVGWTILDGFGTFSPDGVSGVVQDVSDDTIVNVKVGARWTSGRHSMYAGWGHAITTDEWYQDIVRVEYEKRF